MPKDFIRTTESTSLYTNIEKSSTLDILQNINTEDKKVAIDYANVRGCRITPNLYTTTKELDSFVLALKTMSNNA